MSPDVPEKTGIFFDCKANSPRGQVRMENRKEAADLRDRARIHEEKGNYEKAAGLKEEAKKLEEQADGLDKAGGGAGPEVGRRALIDAVIQLQKDVAEMKEELLQIRQMLEQMQKDKGAED